MQLSQQAGLICFTQLQQICGQRLLQAAPRTQQRLQTRSTSDTRMPSVVGCDNAVGCAGPQRAAFDGQVWSGGQ